MDAILSERARRMAEEMAGGVQTAEDLREVMRMPGFDEKVLALYAKGMSTRDIEELLKQLYGVEVSPTLISAVTDVVDKDSKAVAGDLKKIYNAATLAEAETALHEFASVWDEKYPTISKSWRAKWPDIIRLFDFPWPIRNWKLALNHFAILFEDRLPTTANCVPIDP